MADTTSPYLAQASRPGMRRTLALVAMLLALSAAGCQRTPSADPPAPGAQATAQTPSSKAPPDVPAMPEAAQAKPASDAPPSPGSVRDMIYQVDGNGATSYPIENGSVASYWYGHEFELGGKHYFTGFAYDTPEKYGKPDEQHDPDADAQVTLTEATFVMSKPGSSQPWSIQSASRYAGEFGAYEKADDIDEARKALDYATPDGRLLVAIPTKRFETGETAFRYALFLFDPKEPVETDDRHWTYLGSVDAGSENAAACDDEQVMPCVSSAGALSFEPAAKGAMPTVHVAMSGTEIASPGKVRTLGASDRETYTFNAQDHTYAK